MTKKKEAIVFIYGNGGHREQMKRFLSLVDVKLEVEKIGISELGYSLNKEISENYELRPLTDKFSHRKTLINLIPLIFYSIKTVLEITRKYKVKGVVSTGPGVAILPSLFFKFLGKKLIFIEDWCKFQKGTITGRILYKFSDKFYIQNKSLKKQYPKAIYGGKL